MYVFYKKIVNKARKINKKTIFFLTVSHYDVKIKIIYLFRRNTMKKSLLLFLVLGALIFGLLIFASCEDKPANTPNVGETTSGQADAEEEYTGPVPELPEMRFDNKEFVALVYTGNYRDVDLVNSESNGEVLEDAILERNLAIEEKYGVDIKQEQVATGDMYNTLYNLSAAGSVPYHFIVSASDQAFNMSTEGLLTDLNADVPHIDLDAAWWDQGTRENLSIKNKLYYVANSMTLSTHELTWIAMFNKKMLDDVGLSDSDIYGYVKDGTWTLDKYNELTRGFIKDLNNDGYMNTADQYGTAYQGSGPDGFLISGGLRYVTKDQDDALIFQELDDHTLDIINKVYKICQGGVAFNSHYAGTNDKISTETEYGRTLFIENRALFFTESLGSAQGFRDMDADFGIVPLPKYDEKTEKYTSLVHGLGGVVCVPAQCPDVEMTGILLEDMAFLSYRDVEPVYFGLAIEGKYIRDSESIEMVNYIIQNRVIDLGIAGNIGNMCGMLRNAINDATPIFSSIYGRNIRAARTQTEDLNDMFE